MKNLALELTNLPVALQVSDLSDIHDVEPLRESDYDCLSELRDVLKKHGRQERFGVMLLHKHFDLAPDEVLVEYTDVTARVQTIKPEKKGSTLMNTIETSWMLSDGGPESLLACVRYCANNVHGNHDSFHK